MGAKGGVIPTVHIWRRRHSDTRYFKGHTRHYQTASGSISVDGLRAARAVAQQLLAHLAVAVARDLAVRRVARAVDAVKASKSQQARRRRASVRRALPPKGIANGLSEPNTGMGYTRARGILPTAQTAGLGEGDWGGPTPHHMSRPPLLATPTYRASSHASIARQSSLKVPVAA